MNRAISGLSLAAFMALAAPASAQEVKVVGVSIPAATHGWAGGLNHFALETVKRLEALYPELDFVLATASGPGEQVDDIEDMVATRNLDALVVLPFESEPLTGPVQAVAEAGIWVTVVDRGLAVRGIEDLYVAGDNPGYGRVAGEYFVSALPEGAKIVVLRGVPTTIDNERVAAFRQALEGSGIEILGMEHGDWNRDRAFNVTQDLLSRHPRIDAIWAADDDMAVGALAAVEAAGRADVGFVLGGGGMKEMVARTRDGDPMVPANVTYPPAMIATAIEVTALGLVSSAPVSGEFIIGSALITPENAARHHFPDSPF